MIQQNTLFDLEEFSAASSDKHSSFTDWEADTDNGLGTAKRWVDPKKDLGTKAQNLDPKRLAAIAQEWSIDQLEEALAILQALAESKKPDNSEKVQGTIELKMINGCGPYQYLRYYDKGKRRSVYLGKAAKPESQSQSP